MRVSRLGIRGPPIAELRQAGSAGVPVAYSVARSRVLHVEIACCLGRSLQCFNGRLDCGFVWRGVRDEPEKFDLFRSAEHGPCQTPRPGSEGRIALLGCRAAKLATRRVEDSLMSGTTCDLRRVVYVASVAVIYIKGGRSPRVHHQAIKQADPAILLR